jgi:hypothetical protein
VPQSFTDELLRRLGAELGQDFLAAPAGGAVAAGLGTALGAVGVAKAGAFTLTSWQIGLGVLLVGIAGAGLMAALRPAGAAPAPLAMVTVQAPGPVTALAPPSAIDPAPPPPGTAPADVKSSAVLPSATQIRLLDSAGAMLKNHQPAKAIAVLSRITAPDLVEERDRLRQLAVAQLPGAGQR